MKHIKYIPLILIIFVLLSSVLQPGCSYLTHKTYSTENTPDSGSIIMPDPNYNVTLDFNYQDFVSYFYMGNRVENFTAYFNTFYRSQEDFNDAYDEYRSTIISQYNKRLDSLGTVVPISASVKEKLEKAIERSSKIIQFSKNSKYIDQAVLIIGKSYYFQGLYFKAERTFNEFLSKFSSSPLADEAILFLGQTKIRLGKKDDGEKIFKTLSKDADDPVVKSLAFRNLGIMSFNKGNSQQAVEYFESSIKYAVSDERKAEEQFILSKILSVYKPELAAESYKKVLDYTSDFDLKFYSRLNYAKGLVYNKSFTIADEELDDLRYKYREEPAFTQLVDLEIANSYYAQGKFPQALDKYYEIIVKYPNSAVSSDAYYFLGKHEEDVNKDYLNAYVNYKKATEENINSDYIKESEAKSSTFEQYFALEGEIKDSTKADIPTVNANVEKYRRKYNEEKGIENPEETNKNSNYQDNDNKGNQNNNPDGTRKGEDEGKPGGVKETAVFRDDDSLKIRERAPDEDIKIPENEGQPDQNVKPEGKNPGQMENPPDGVTENPEDILSDSLNSLKADSINAAQELAVQKEKEDRKFNAYYGLAELFMYNMQQNDSAEYYLKLLLNEFRESDKRTKILYTLGNFYKNINKTEEGDSVFQSIIDDYPNTVYANESRKILGLKLEKNINLNPVDDLFTSALLQLDSSNYTQAISELEKVEKLFPNDTMVAKSLYSIGWIYENKLVNKDSALSYYNKLRTKFPESEYSYKISPVLDYIASIEQKNKPDSTNVNPESNDSLKTEPTGVTTDEGNEETKNETVKESKPDENLKEKTEPEEEGKTTLSQEEIDKLLKETEGDGN
ncbi:MAG TPA: tetratricopeptide repeat protein [Ignavibacteria bacterium]|nr:tetratricopeptide repeat protein [Ignavibacteria bacterium]HMR41778.1 tetratricopeptide repeat protein [Ignavibacteria bacterium]